MKIYGGSGGRFTTQEKDRDTQYIGGRVGPRAFMGAGGKKKILTLPGIDPWPSSV
jgi:hypothetical protein